MFKISFQADLEGYKRQLADEQERVRRAARDRSAPAFENHMGAGG